ncbi:hypothetical protein VN97_g1830 [Penicillium thymicola]|uniref:Uncharacterized protein n=1 Tax=Penicillium thymicola TaxID=293382 RepID=A0AAI9TRD4_PENTH|nr:hypothetical protein VN97_g1830 [Penicillium thymicola]
MLIVSKHPPCIPWDSTSDYDAQMLSDLLENTHEKTSLIWVWSCMGLNDVDVSYIGTRVATGPSPYVVSWGLRRDGGREGEGWRKKRRGRGRKVGGVLLYVHTPGTFLKWTTLQRTFPDSPMSHVTNIT